MHLNDRRQQVWVVTAFAPEVRHVGTFSQVWGQLHTKPQSPLHGYLNTTKSAPGPQKLMQTVFGLKIR